MRTRPRPHETSPLAVVCSGSRRVTLPTLCLLPLSLGSPPPPPPSLPPSPNTPYYTSSSSVPVFPPLALYFPLLPTSQRSSVRGWRGVTGTGRWRVGRDRDYVGSAVRVCSPPVFPLNGAPQPSVRVHRTPRVRLRCDVPVRPPPPRQAPRLLSGAGFPSHLPTPRGAPRAWSSTRPRGPWERALEGRERVERAASRLLGPVAASRTAWARGSSTATPRPVDPWPAPRRPDRRPQPDATVAAPRPPRHGAARRQTAS